MRLVVAENAGICGICGHGGAKTGDHIVPWWKWPRDQYGKPLPGVDGKENCRPAHGTRGFAPPNPCPVCGQLCNQKRGGDRQPRSPRSVNW